MEVRFRGREKIKRLNLAWEDIRSLLVYLTTQSRISHRKNLHLYRINAQRSKTIN